MFEGTAEGYLTTQPVPDGYVLIPADILVPLETITPPPTHVDAELGRLGCHKL
jgi:hypothetical protein